VYPISIHSQIISSWLSFPKNIIFLLIHLIVSPWMSPLISCLVSSSIYHNIWYIPSIYHNISYIPLTFHQYIPIINDWPLENSQFDPKNHQCWMDTNLPTPFSCIYVLHLSHYIPSGWWFGTWILLLSIYWDFHHPNWRTHIFQRGRYTTNQPLLHY